MFKLFIGFWFGFFVATCVFEPNAAKHVLSAVVDSVQATAAETPNATKTVVNNATDVANTFGKTNN